MRSAPVKLVSCVSNRVLPMVFAHIHLSDDADDVASAPVFAPLSVSFYIDVRDFRERGRVGSEKSWVIFELGQG